MRTKIKIGDRTIASWRVYITGSAAMYTEQIERSEAAICELISAVASGKVSATIAENLELKSELDRYQFAFYEAKRLSENGCATHAAMCRLDPERTGSREPVGAACADIRRQLDISTEQFAEQEEKLSAALQKIHDLVRQLELLTAVPVAPIRIDESIHLGTFELNSDDWTVTGPVQIQASGPTEMKTGTEWLCDCGERVETSCITTNYHYGHCLSCGKDHERPTA